jgi:hypothetical protein
MSEKQGPHEFHWPVRCGTCGHWSMGVCSLHAMRTDCMQVCDDFKAESND